MRVISCLFFLIIISALLSSCRKNDAYLPSAATPENFNQIFEAFWNGMNVNYVYWDIDKTNWDSVYVKYKPVFSRLSITNDKDVKMSVQYFRLMTNRLIDSHYHIDFSINSIADSIVNPAMEMKRKNPYYHDLYGYSAIDAKYLDSGYLIGYDYVNNQGQSPLFVQCGKINNRILYFTCNQFSLFRSYYSGSANTVKPVIQYFLDNIRNSTGLTGIIIDVRGNLGGDLSDLNFIVGQFISTPLHFGYTRYKSGNGRLDYTPWIKAFVNPQAGAKTVALPIVVLADNYSASLSEAIAMAIHTLPNGKFIGENTWGATGPITANQVYNDGQFKVGGFLTVTTSSAAFKYIDGKVYEQEGFPPDIYVPFNLEQLHNGIDKQLEEAIQLIN